MYSAPVVVNETQIRAGWPVTGVSCTGLPSRCLTLSWWEVWTRSVAVDAARIPLEMSSVDYGEMSLETELQIFPGLF